MVQLFLSIRFLDIIDILLVAFLLYQLYMLVKGTAAFNIILGVFMFYIAWFLVRAMNMELLSNILGQFISVGVIVLVVVFQKEIRKALLLLGTRYGVNSNLNIESLFLKHRRKPAKRPYVLDLVMACENMSQTKTGALIVLTNSVELNEYVETGDLLDAKISSQILESIFFKNSPLHDGAVIIQSGRIISARCILPVTDKNLSKKLGLRHRAAMGMCEITDAEVIVVSEETGRISYFFQDKIHENITPVQLSHLVNDRKIDDKEEE